MSATIPDNLGEDHGWIRPLQEGAGPRYLQIARMVIHAVEEGRLATGDRLPPQRELARYLGVDLTTITRAYNQVRAAGLLNAQGASGTFVSSPLTDRAETLDLSMNIPPLLGSVDFVRLMHSGLSHLKGQLGDGSLMSYHVGAGSRLDREAAARWLEPAFGTLAHERLLVCAGAQAAISALLLAYSRPGDTVAAESLTYPGLLAACRVMQRRAVAVDMDGEGMLPEALEQLCKTEPPRLIYLVPTIQNPTATTMSAQRREAIYAIACRYSIAVIEDDPYWLLAGDAPPPLASLRGGAPVYYVSTLSKCLAPGLRTAYILMPEGESPEPVLDALRGMMLMAQQGAVSMATSWIRTGMAQDMLQQVRAELAQRQALAARLLPGIQQAHTNGLHLWLSLPRWQQPERLLQVAQEQGLGVAGSQAFCSQAHEVHGLRVSLGGAPDQASLASALQKLADILAEPAVSAPVRQVIV